MNDTQFNPTNNYIACLDIKSFISEATGKASNPWPYPETPKSNLAKINIVQTNLIYLFDLSASPKWLVTIQKSE